MFIKASFTVRWYWQIALIFNLAKFIGAKTTFYSGGTGSDWTQHPMEGEMEEVHISTLHGDYDVLIGNKWQRGFNRLWKAKIYKWWLEARWKRME